MEKFLSVVIVIILSFYVLKWILRLIMPFLLKKLIQKIGGQSFGHNFDFSNQQHYEEQNEGEVKVTNQQHKSSNNTKEKGEYVDFEEIK